MAQTRELWACSVCGEERRKESVRSLNSVDERRPGYQCQNAAAAYSVFLVDLPWINLVSPSW
jgi:hypothetical protein